MPISSFESTIGPQERNTTKDVARAQALLRLTKQASMSRGYYDGRIDGRCGPKTESAVKAFQTAQANKSATRSQNTKPGRLSPHDGSARALEEACALSLSRSEMERLRVLAPPFGGGAPLVIIGATQSEMNEAERLAQNAVLGLCARTKSAIEQMVKDIYADTGLALTVLPDSGSQLALGAVGFRQVTQQGVSNQSGPKKVKLLPVSSQEGELIGSAGHLLSEAFAEYITDPVRRAGAGLSGLVHSGNAAHYEQVQAEIRICGRIAEWRRKGWREAADALQHFLDGSGNALQFRSDDLLKNKRFAEAVEELRQRWEKEFKGIKNTEDSQLLTYRDLRKAAFGGQTGQRTVELDKFSIALRQDETLQMGSSLGLTFGGTSIWAGAYQGLEIIDVEYKGGDIVVRAEGIITFSIVDPYDFKKHLPGGRDAHILMGRADHPAKPFNMQVKWTEQVTVSVVFERLPEAPSGSLTEPSQLKAKKASIGWTLRSHNVPVNKDEDAVRNREASP